VGYAQRFGLGRQERERERQIAELDDQQRVRELAARIPDEPTLIKILDDCQPGYRDAVKAQLWPYLPFTPTTEPPPPAALPQDPIDAPTPDESEGVGTLHGEPL
jgi:hypothetical protein